MCLKQHGSRRVLKISSPALLQCTVIVSVLLTLVEGATWISQPRDQNVTVGRNVTFPCEVQDPNNNLTKIWNKGTTPIFINGVAGQTTPNRYSVTGVNTLSIRNVELDDDSFYTCSIFTFDYVQVKLTVLLPPGPPSITTNVSSSQFVENSVISFNCSSTGGKPAPKIEWLRNGQPLNSAIYSPPSVAMGTASSHIIVTLQRSDHSANYTCKVYNEANQNSPLVQTRTLNVQYAPSIHFEPNYSPYHVKINSEVNLRCVVDANPRYASIEWYKDGVQLPVATNTLSFNSIQKTDLGNYTCTATNVIQGTAHKASAFVLIDVIYAPIITTQNLIIANISTHVTMTCQVDANPPATRITWKKLGNDPIEANGPDFEFTAEKRFDGNYSCTAYSRLQPSGLDPEDISSTGTTIVKIQYAPGQASIRPVSSVLVGQTIMLSCTVDDLGYPYPVYEWRKVGSPQILQSATSPKYTIPSAALADNGDYTCLPTNIMGQGTPATIKVVVNSPPEFFQSTPTGSLLTIPITQSNVYLEHKIDGRPIPNVQWFKDGQPLTMMSDLYDIGSTNVTIDQYKYRVTTRVSFRGLGRDQNRLQINDLGNYTCRVLSPDTGSPVERSIYLSLQFSPHVTASPRVAADIGESATLKCTAQANPVPVFYWFRQGQRLTNSSRISLHQLGTGGTAMYEGILQIESTQQDDFGDYVCEVNNSKGQIRKTLTLSVKGKPEPPMNLMSIEKTWESVKLKWESGFNGGYAQTFYIAVQSVYGEKTVEVYPNGVNTFNVTRLMPHTSYNFFVYGQNTLGRGAKSTAFTDTTKVLSFPALVEIPKFEVEEKKLEIPNELGQSYCLRVAISTDDRKKWTVVEPCVTATDGVVALAHQGATDLNVSVCLVYRPEVCGDPVMAEINEPSTPDLTETQVIIIGCVCATILIVLLIILVCIVWRRRQKNKNYTNDPHSPRTVQQGNGALPNQKPRTYDNQDGLHFDNRNGYPVQYLNNPGDNYPMGDMSYDSHSYDKQYQYEYEMNRRNANISGDPYYNEKQGNLSFSGGSPRTPTKDPQQFINVPEDHTKEGGSFGSGNESGYSTPDKAKPKKVKSVGPSIFHFHHQSKKYKNIVTNPDMVPYSHNPPGHTCGLPCCSKDLQVQLRIRKPPRSCMGIQEHEILGQNFTFKGKLKSGPGLENGFFSVQEAKEAPHADIPKFGSVRGAPTNISEEQKKYNFLKGREITLPEAEDPYAIEKLYLEDFNLGESDDFENFEMKGYDSGIDTIRENEIDYYVSVKNPSDPEKGVPYDPKDIDNTHIYPWDLLKGLKDNLSNRSASEKGDDSSSSNYYSSGSNYYEVIRIPEEKPLSKNDQDENVIADKTDQKIDQRSDESKKKSKTFPLAVSLPALPPKPPVQNQFNHPPLKKPEKTKPEVPSGNVPEQPSKILGSDSDSSQTRYNMYSSVCSITSMANKMSKEAYERFMSLDRASVSQKSFRRDVRDFDFTGNDMPLGSKNLDLAVTKAKLNQLFRDKGTNSLYQRESKNFETLKVNRYQDDTKHNDEKRLSLKKDLNMENDKQDDLKEKLMDFDHLSKQFSDDDDDTDDYNGVINPGFKHINVDGKILGSRYSLDHESSFGEEVCDRFLHLWERGDDNVNEDEMKVMELLKDRLRNVDNSEDSPSGESFNDNPITLIL